MLTIIQLYQKYYMIPKIHVHYYYKYTKKVYKNQNKT